MIFGYARVSTKDQLLERQIDSLKLAGCDEIYQEKVSGRKKEKPELDKLLSNLRKGDMLIVDSLDRLGRTAKELIRLLNFFKEQGIQFRSLKEGMFDTTSPMGEAVMQIIAILKAMEVEVIRERTMDGLKAARARGRNGGRKPGSYDKEKAKLAASLYEKGEISVSEIMKAAQIRSKSTLYEYLRYEGVFGG
jgi:DNA invertase Pin-like site-specific DNA recombinase